MVDSSKNGSNIFFIYGTHLVKSVIKYYNVCDSEKPITKVKPGNWVCNLKIVCQSYVVEAKH